MKKVVARIFWIIVILLMFIAIFEFYRIRNGKKPLFCVKTVEHVYRDGVTNECIGLGYKVFEYKRTYLKGTEFVSIFTSERHEDIDNQNEDSNIDEDNTLNSDDALTSDDNLVNEDIEVIE